MTEISSTKQLGDIAELKVMARFLEKGYHVLVPHGDYAPYDLVTEKDGVFQRIQVKSGRIREGVIMFNTTSSHYKSRQDYRGLADSFAVFCFDNDQCYLVDVLAAPTGGEMYLRIDTPRNGQTKGINWAHQYEL